MVNAGLFLANLPTSEKIFGVYGAVWLILLTLIANAIFARRVYHLLSVLAQGRRENRLDKIGVRIGMFVKEVLLQSRMLAGDSIINWAHPLTFWGFCGFVIASALMFTGGMLDPFLPHGMSIPQAEQIPILGTIVDLFAVLVLVALAASSFRRYILAPPGLQRTWDATIVVFLIAALMVTFLVTEAGGYVEESALAAAGQEADGWSQTWLPMGIVTAKVLLGLGVSEESLKSAGLASWWIHMSILLFFLIYLPYSKHMHLLWTPFAVFFGELPDKKGALTLPPDADPDAPAPETPLGVFTWRQLLNAYTCAECGRCERACPAVASGEKLSPRKIVHDLKEYVLNEGLAFGRDGASGANGGRKLVGDIVEPEALWACATCFACVDKCPVRNEHVPLIVEMRRKLVEEGNLDASLQETLMSLQRYGNSQGKSPRKRFEWAKDLSQPIKDAAKEPVKTLWFLGDYAAYHPSSMRVSRMVAQIFQNMELDFGCLLKGEKSVGNDVRRVGEEGLFEMLAEQNMKELDKAEFDRIVTTDPHTYHALKHEYPRFGLDKPVLHYTQVLDEAFQSAQLTVGHKLEGTAVLHDACYLGRYNGIYEEPRRVLSALGLKLVEMPRNYENSFCCGAGGGRIWMKDAPDIEERPAELRVKEALTLQGVDYFVVACPKDLAMFEDAVKTVGAEDRLKVVDLGELVFKATCETAEIGVES